MSTPTAASIETVGSIVTEKSRVRTYVKTNTDDKGKVFITEHSVQFEAEAKDKETGAPVNWQAKEKEGFSLFSENDVIKYTIKNWEGAELLTPDSEQRLYIYQAGLNSIQSSRIGPLLKEVNDTVDGPAPALNGQVIDLKEEINREPKRGRSLTEEEKIENLLRAQNLPVDQLAAIMLSIREAKQQAQVQEVEVAA